MACRFEVTLPLSDRAGVPAAQAALDEIDQLEAQLTIFRESSEVSELNRMAFFTSMRVEPRLFALLWRCQELHRETEGAFDITSGPLTRAWGFLSRAGRWPEADELAAALSGVGGEKLLLNYEQRSIQFAHPQLEINLGSIGKGYALDRVAATLRRRGIGSALLNAGSSSFRAIGAGETRARGWSVGLRHPRDKDRRLALLWLRDCALSTSGSEEQFFEHEGKRYGHIIDPRSGLPAEKVTSVSVVADSTAVSDALATAFYVGGRELAESYCARHPQVLAIMLESGSDVPLVIGDSRGCTVQLLGS